MNKNAIFRNKCSNQLNFSIIPPQEQGTLGKKCRRMAVTYPVNNKSNAVAAQKPTVLPLSVYNNITITISTVGIVPIIRLLAHNGKG
jgi:hypothetical protein